MPFLSAFPKREKDAIFWFGPRWIASWLHHLYSAFPWYLDVLFLEQGQGERYDDDCESGRIICTKSISVRKTSFEPNVSKCQIETKSKDNNIRVTKGIFNFRGLLKISILTIKNKTSRITKSNAIHLAQVFPQILYITKRLNFLKFFQRMKASESHVTSHTQQPWHGQQPY